MSDSMHASAAVYKPWTLTLYDLYVISFSNTFVWKCPSPTILEFFNNHISNNHLDIGVGTGYFLDKCVFPSANPNITLMDLNPDCLTVSAKRIERYQPKTIVADICATLPFTTQRFDSVSLNYLLHCLHGNIHQKACVFKNIDPCLNPQATVFGMTVLGKHARGVLAKLQLKVLNNKGIMGNMMDTREDLDAVLKQHFASYSIWEIGNVAFFVGRKG